MKMQTKDLGNKSVTVRLALYKVGITACLAIIISMFLFACGSGRNAGNTDTTASMQTDSSSVAPADTATAMPVDTAGVKPDTTPIH
jgi:hypothetical protein